MTRSRSRDDAGFTLIEILVVLLILGILAAIAIPQFTQQTEKAKDAEAQSLARNLQTHAESCRAQARSWAECDTAAEVLPKGEMKWGRQAGEVEVLVKPFGLDAIVFAAWSKTGSMFALLHAERDQTQQKLCYVPSNAYPTGACRQGGPFPGFGRW